ncbi:MAG: hypothetical protein V3R96_03235, partial [Dehalococcoidales bacterium]
MTEFNPPRIALKPRPVFNSLDDLVQGLTFREPLKNNDGRSDAALERHGNKTGAWWESQLALAMLGVVIQFG